MFTLAKLPYAYNSLEPYIDEQTMITHHDKHHQGYVDNLNKAIAGYQDLQDKTVEQLLSDLDKLPVEIRTLVKNHGGGHANHSLFWSILTKNQGVPDNQVTKAIISDFGSFDKFKDVFSTTAASVFGSGWAWLVLKKDKLAVYQTSNQDSPLSQGDIPLLTLDVWEHAYYLKYQNKRVDYINAFFNIINWQQVNQLFLAAKAKT